MKLNKLRNISTDRTSSGYLSSLWRQILVDLDIVEKIPSLIMRYNHRLSNNNKSDGIIAISTVKNNIFSDAITFKTFVFLVKEILSVKSIRLSITITHIDNQKTTHGVDMKFTKQEESE